MRVAATSVLVRGIRRRLMGSFLVVITAAIAVATAIVGPLFVRAGGDWLVRQVVADAGPGAGRRVCLGFSDVSLLAREPSRGRGLCR